MSSKKRVAVASVLAAALLAAGLLAGCGGEPPAPPGGIRIAPAEPVQHSVEPFTLYEHDGHRVTALATFSATARVLSAKRYRFDDQADFSPLDLAVGWGAMSDSAALKPLKIFQARRWYFTVWRWDNPPLVSDIVMRESSANWHIVPMSDDVAGTLKGARPHDLVRLSGYLVRIDGPDGYLWHSSMTRHDDGDGACELIFVTNAQVIPAEEINRRIADGQFSSQDGHFRLTAVSD